MISLICGFPAEERADFDAVVSKRDRRGCGDAVETCGP